MKSIVSIVILGLLAAFVRQRDVVGTVVADARFADGLAVTHEHDQLQFLRDLHPILFSSATAGVASQPRRHDRARRSCRPAARPVYAAR